MNTSTICISAKNLKRVYRTVARGKGVAGALRRFMFRSWNEKVAVKNLTFTINEGECVGFLGPNGAGKTTLLKMLSGILVPTSGTCSVMGFTPHKRSRDFRRSIAFITGQRSQLMWDLPPIDSFQLHRDLYGVDPLLWQKTLDELVDLLSVAHVLQTPTRQLSLGERMKCELILSLLHHPKVLFLDEPTIGIDVVSQRNVWEFLRKYHRERGITILLTSHSIADIEQLCSRVVVVGKGRKIFDGTLGGLADIFEPEHTVTLRLRQAADDQTLLILSRMTLGVEQTDPNFFICRVRHSVTPAFLAYVQRNLVLADWDVSPTNFGDVLARTYASTAKHLTIASDQSDAAKKVKRINGE
jgi:ABC-2 type transport system ATP-binding protein